MNALIGPMPVPIICRDVNRTANTIFCLMKLIKMAKVPITKYRQVSSNFLLITFRKALMPSVIIAQAVLATEFTMNVDVSIVSRHTVSTPLDCKVKKILH